MFAAGDVSPHRADMWAVGCIIFQMLEGRPPFRAASEYLCFQKVIARDVSMPDNLHPHARDLIEKLLVRGREGGRRREEEGVALFLYMKDEVLFFYNIIIFSEVILELCG